MLPNAKPEPGSPADWLRHAQSDLTLAAIELPREVLYSELCFHAQQAVEKSLKAVLLHFGVEFRKAHDIDYLITLLPSETSTPLEASELASLTNYAVMFRYPGDYEDVTEEEYRWAVQRAQVVYAWAQHLIDPSRATTH
jgi:HEPN domain-containing protein